tara:strand:+ start:1096 stop:1422 length:327 start_codon:yes stop_codon:yes gene_type:complete
MYKELNGRHMRRQKNSKAMECAMRYLVEQNVFCSAHQVYMNMKTKSGKYYRNSRMCPDLKAFHARMHSNPYLKKHYTDRGTMMYYTTEEKYNKAFPTDPCHKKGDGKW